MKSSKLNIKQVEYHRNGVGGLGFVAVLFHDSEVGDDMIATIFPQTSDIACAVYSIPKLSTGGVTFGENSWRGDRYFQVLQAFEEVREAIKLAKE